MSVSVAIMGNIGSTAALSEIFISQFLGNVLPFLRDKEYVISAHH